MDAPTMGASFFISSKAFMEDIVVCLIADGLIVLLFDFGVDVLCDGNGGMPHARLCVLCGELRGVHDSRIGVAQLVSG